MQYITEFLKLRERLNHSYITPKILMRIEPRPEIIKYTFENPKIWYQVMLRIQVLFDIGENTFKLECPEVFGSIKNKMEAIIRGIETIRAAGKGGESCQQMVTYADTLFKLIRKMSNYEYVVKSHELKTLMEPGKDRLLEIRLQCRGLGEKVEKALILTGGWDPEFLQLGMTYWDNRVHLERLVIRQMVFMDQQRRVSGQELWNALFVLVDTDWTAEEALALEATKQKRKTAVGKLLSEKNMSSVKQYFNMIETKLFGFLEV